MNQNDSSGANAGLDIGAAAKPAVASRSAASALLSATAIWSTNEAPAARAEAPTTPTAPVSADIAEQAQIVEQVAEPIPEPVAPKRKLRPSELVAEARFFSSSAKRAPDVDPAPRP